VKRKLGFLIILLIVCLGLTRPARADDVQVQFNGIAPATGAIIAGANNGNNPSFNVNFNLNLAGNAVISSATLSYFQDAYAPDTDNIILIDYYTNQTIDVVNAAMPGTKSSDRFTTTVQNWLVNPNQNFGIKFQGGSSNNSDRITLSNIQLTVLYHLPDLIPPKILVTGITRLTDTQYKLTLTADEPVTVVVNYGKTSNYGFLAAPTPVVTMPVPTILPTETPAELKDIYLNGLLIGLTYHYQFVLKDTSGNVTKSQDYMFLTGSTAANKTDSLLTDTSLTVPQDLTLELVHNNSGVAGVQLSWSPPSGNNNIDGYLLYRAIGARDFQEMAQLDKSTLTFTDQQIDPGAEYTYTVRSFQGTSLSNQAEPQKIAIPLLAQITPVPEQNDTRPQIFLALLAGAAVIFLIGYWIYHVFDRILGIFRPVHPRKQIKNVLKDPDLVE
jgi:hypothetical protein